MTRLESVEVFHVVWLTVAASFAAMYSLAFRFSWLRRTKQAEDAPFAVDFLFGGLGWTSFSYLIGLRRISKPDAPATILLITWRTLFVLALVGMGYLWLIGFGRR